MNKEPLVSIIVNNYNYGCFIGDAIDSALNQTYSNIEVIVVDDGSTDNSLEVINGFANEVIAIIKENGGQASAFNLAIKQSHGDIIVFLDSDDVLLPSAIEKAVELFSEVGVIKIHWPLLRVDANGSTTGRIVPEYPLAEGNLLDTLIKNGPAEFCGKLFSPPTSGSAWSGKYLQEVFPIPELEFRTGGIDYYLMVLTPVFGEIRSLSEPLGHYRVHGSNDTLKPLDDYLKSFFIWFELACSSLAKHLHNKGIDVDPITWPRNSWFHQVHKAMQDIAAAVRPADSFILVDDNHLGTNGVVHGRRRLPFMEINGQYWGLPENDNIAIMEIERQKKEGTAFIIFAWPAFWMLDYYHGMHDYLKSNYKCILNNERLIGFDLRSNH